MSESVQIERLGHLGDGIAPGPVFVARALPGEIVSGPVDGSRIDQPRIEKPSDQRIAPPCPHYGGCGGCSLMHARDEFVADFKAEIVRQALAAQKLNASHIGIITSPPESRRRAALSGRRTKKGALVGFHARASGTIQTVPECRVVVPEIRAALVWLERIVVWVRRERAKFR